MREITILKDGILPRMPTVSKYIRNTLYIILALSLIAAAIIKRHEVLDPSTMVTNIAVIAMVSYPVAVIFTILIKFLLGFITSEEFTVTSKKVYGFTTLGRPVEILLTDIAEVSSFRFIFKSISITDKDGVTRRFIGLRNSDRIVLLLEHLCKESSKSENSNGSSDALDTAKELQRYSEMNKNGLLSASELQAVKKQIVGL